MAPSGSPLLPFPLFLLTSLSSFSSLAVSFPTRTPLNKRWVTFCLFRGWVGSISRIKQGVFSSTLSFYSPCSPFLQSSIESLAKMSQNLQKQPSFPPNSSVSLFLWLFLWPCNLHALSFIYLRHADSLHGLILLIRATLYQNTPPISGYFGGKRTFCSGFRPHFSYLCSILHVFWAYSSRSCWFIRVSVARSSSIMLHTNNYTASVRARWREVRERERETDAKERIERKGEMDTSKSHWLLLLLSFSPLKISWVF